MTETQRVINVGIIGNGQIGKVHINNYSKIPNVNMVAVCDIIEAEARGMSEKYNIPNVYTDYRQLLERDDIEAVDVCLHNNLHRPMTEAALMAGKHVYCEKPMAGTYTDAESMFKTAQSVGRKLSIQLSTLFSRETRAAKLLIETGRLGKLYHARSTGFRRRGRPYVDGYGSSNFVKKEIAAGGALYDMGVYHIASTLYLLGNPAVRTITGKLYQEMEIDAARKASSGYNVEELGMGFVRLSNNIALDIIESWAIHLDHFDGTTVVGSQGGVRIEPFGYFFNDGDLEMSATANLDTFIYRLSNVHGTNDLYESAQHHWIAALQGRVELLPTAELALNTMLISEGIALSEKLDREVSADEVRQMSKSTAIKL